MLNIFSVVRCMTKNNYISKVWQNVALQILRISFAVQWFYFFLISITHLENKTPFIIFQYLYTHLFYGCEKKIYTKQKRNNKIKKKRLQSNDLNHKLHTLHLSCVEWFHQRCSSKPNRMHSDAVFILGAQYCFSQQVIHELISSKIFVKRITTNIQRQIFFLFFTHTQVKQRPKTTITTIAQHSTARLWIISDYLAVAKNNCLCWS